MSSPQPFQQSQLNLINPNKPITGAFDLQTKIRVIIQQVLNATMRKVSQLHEKVQNFEKFFFTYSQRFGDVQQKGNANEQSLIKLLDTVVKNKQIGEIELIKLQQKQQKLKLQKNQLVEEIKQINRKIKIINRQNQTMTNQLSNTKKRFLQFSDQMTTIKQQVSWKITKYIQQTAQINTKIQINNEQIKKQYFNLQLSLQKNKQKYQQIVNNTTKQQHINIKIKQDILDIKNNLQNKFESLDSFNKKIQQMDTAIYTKIKTIQNKLDKKIQDLYQHYLGIMESVKKLDGFSATLEQVRENSQRVRRQLLKKFQESDQKNNDKIQKQILSTQTNLFNLQKLVDKKIRTITQNQQKNADFITQRIQYLKIEIDNQISTKATKMVQQHSKSQKSVSNSVVQQFQQKINQLNRLSIETKKQIVKYDNILKQIKLQIKHQIHDIKDHVDVKINNTVKNIQESKKTGISMEFLQNINQKIQKVSDNMLSKFNQVFKCITNQNVKIQELESLKYEAQQKFVKLQQGNAHKFSELQQRLSNKAERVLYTVTKLRSDSIIKNQFLQKQIKQIKKAAKHTQKSMNTITKLFPAMGECINLLMCIIYDEQNTKIICSDNNVNGLKDKNQIKFQNLVQGILYQFGQQKNIGCIIYRHREQSKVDIVKATFLAYTEVWEDLFNNDYRERQDLIPKYFYKKYVEKCMGRNTGSNHEKSQGSQTQLPIITHLTHHESSRQERMTGSIGSESSSNGRKKWGGQSSDLMNRSFHVRKKKMSQIKNKEDPILILKEQIQQVKQ